VPVAQALSYSFGHFLEAVFHNTSAAIDFAPPPRAGAPGDGAGAEEGGEVDAGAVSHFWSCIGSPCLRQCVHGASIGGGGGGGGPSSSNRTRQRALPGVSGVHAVLQVRGTGAGHGSI
jgi:hypothetical protein